VKFGPIPENPLESLALRMGKIPTPVLDVLFGPLKARVVMASVKLGLIDALAAAPSSAAQLASSLKLDPECVEMLLRVLVHCEYVEWDGSRFSLSSLALRTLAPGAPMDRRGYVEWNYTQWDIIGRLEDLMRSGKGIDLHQTLIDDHAWSFYQRGMLENSRDHAELLAHKVRVPKGAKSLIDLGGSHGLLGAAICRKHPPMRSTVFDLEPAIASARELAQAEGIADIVTHSAADILKDDLGTGHDVALLANILHHFTPQENAIVLEKVRQSLRTGGTIAIWEFEKPKRDDKVSAGDALALYFRLTSSASAYHADEYTAWLQATGFHRVRVLRPKLVPGYVLVSADTLLPRSVAGGRVFTHGRQ
jgi:O-methyltransferase domain